MLEITILKGRRQKFGIFYFLNKGGGPGFLIFLCFLSNHFCTKNIQKCYETYDAILWIESVLGLLEGAGFRGS